MEYKMLIGETLLDFRVAHSIKWKAEDKLFLYENEIYHQKVDITIEMVDEFPELIKKELYVTEGMQIGVDKNNNEVRKYRATFLTGKPVYALSILKDEKIKIYFKNVNNIWNNPNIRVWNLIHMENILLNVNALVLHCSYLRYENQAILFSAPSGTGKTTQAKLWEKNYSCKIINGDKAIIQKKNGKWYACGYPFHGSAAECINEDYPIKAIVVVRQSKRDYVEELTLLKKISDIYSETTINSWNEKVINKAVDLIGDLVNEVPIVCQHCTMEDEASFILHKYLDEEVRDGTI